MKISFTLTLVFAMMAASFAVAQDEKTETTKVAWFDMDNCEICKSMAADKDMMQHVKWETHLLDNGLLSVSVVPENMKAKMAKAKKGMKAAVARLETGEDMKLCGYCMGYGELIAAGADKQELSTAGGEIMMLTSTDPKLVEKIHAHAKRTITEHKKMMEEMNKEHGHHQGDTEEHKADGTK